MDKLAPTTEIALIENQKLRSFNVRKLYRLLMDFHLSPDASRRWEGFLKVGDFVEDAMKSSLTVSTNDKTTTTQTNSPNGGETNV